MNKIPEGPAGFGTRLRAYRRLRNMSCEELAKRMRMSTHGTICHWESGRNLPGFWSLVELSHVLQVSLDDLLDVHFGVHHDRTHHQALPTQARPALLHDGGAADVCRDGKCK